MKNNIIWLASYPKSGNTMVRAFLSAYFFTKDGILKDFSPLKNITSFNQFSNFKYIKDFPNINFFKKNPESVSKYWLLNQKIINQKLNKEVIFFKTHSARIKYQSEYFTNNARQRIDSRRCEPLNAMHTRNICSGTRIYTLETLNHYTVTATCSDRFIRRRLRDQSGHRPTGAPVRIRVQRNPAGTSKFPPDAADAGRRVV